MASHPCEPGEPVPVPNPPGPDGDNPLLDDVPHASATRWRHQESGAYRKAAAHTAEADGKRLGDRHGHGPSRVADSARVSSEELRRETGGENGDMTRSEAPSAMAAAAAAAAQDAGHNNVDGHGHVPRDGKHIVCGPLLNYRRMEEGTWVGSVLVVTEGGGATQQHVPTLKLARVGPRQQQQQQQGMTAGGATIVASHGETSVQGLCLYSDARNTFWRFDLVVAVERSETEWAYTLPDLRLGSKTNQPHRNAFFVPAASESMRIMFHSCNGFSVGTDEAAWSGPALWHDVMRKHRETPFHVMLGGGDQIYNDGIRVNGPLRQWTEIGSPKKRRDYPFPETLRRACDDYYLRNYIKWYSTGPFAAANGQIPQLNIWDDHDVCGLRRRLQLQTSPTAHRCGRLTDPFSPINQIIDGFGSYVNDFMKCHVSKAGFVPSERAKEFLTSPTGIPRHWRDSAQILHAVSTPSTSSAVHIHY